MTTSIKITSLTDIGANLAGSTLVPVVNMTGTPTTQRANVNNIANYVLNKGTGADLGSVGNVVITGGTSGQILSTDGAGNLSWVTGTGGASGFSGFSGFSGAIGTSGYSGVNGSTGTSGYSGVNGSTGTSGYSGVSGYSGQSADPTLVYNLMGTGLQTGGQLAVYNTTAFNIAAGVGYIIDNTDPINPVVTKVEFGPFTNIPVTYLNTNPRSYVSIDIDGNIIQADSAPEGVEYRTQIYLGRLLHQNLTTLTGVIYEPALLIDRQAYFQDLYDALGALNIYGNFISPVGANMQIARTAGEIWRMNANAANGYDNPNITSQAQASPQTFRYQWQSGTPAIYTVGSFTTNVDPDNWDDGTGTLQPVSGGSFTIQRIYIAGSANITAVYITYGQTEYSTANEALAGIQTENPNIDPAFKYLVLKAFLIVKQGSTDLADGVNQIIPNSGLGGAGGGGGPGFSGISGYSGNANIGNVTFDDQVIQGTGDESGGGGLYLAPGINSTANLQYLRVRGGDYITHIHFDTGNNAYFDQYLGDDNKYVKLEAAGNILISPNDGLGNTAQWTFSVGGDLTLPGNLVTPNGANAVIPSTVGTAGAPLIISAGTGGIAATSLNAGNGGNLTINAGDAGSDIGNPSWGAIGGTLVLRAGNSTQPYTGSNVEIRSGNSASIPGAISLYTGANQWTFANDGTLNAAGDIITSGNITALNLINTVTVYANLPAATTAGIRAFISDANLVAAGNFGATVGGAGSNTVPVYSDGANWCIG